jgi:secernin
MCDTLVATGAATADGVTIFGKNSDREPNEAHHLLRVPAADHEPGSAVACTYIEIPQVAHTYAVLLAKPFWIWGGEMGTNEHGVTIGNEAVFTKDPYGKAPGLIGMDFLRLALERAATAREAVEVITALLAAYGQSGNCMLGRELYYHNSFLIADPHDAWVVETSGRHWVAKRVEGVYTISNCLTIRDEWDLASPELVAHAVAEGWCEGAEDFDFARCYAEGIDAKFLAGRDRRSRTMALLTRRAGAITPATMMATLRDHGADAGDDWAPDADLEGATVCMHAAVGPGRGSQTTGSMVSHLHPDHPTHFLTATAAPCTGLFKPLWVDHDLPDTGPVPGGAYDAAALYWRHEVLHRATLRDYAARIRTYAPERDKLEAALIDQALALADQGPAARAAFAARCFSDAAVAEAHWLEGIVAAPIEEGATDAYLQAWHKRNHEAGMPV